MRPISSGAASSRPAAPCRPQCRWPRRHRVQPFPSCTVIDADHSRPPPPRGKSRVGAGARAPVHSAGPGQRAHERPHPTRSSGHTYAGFMESSLTGSLPDSLTDALSGPLAGPLGKIAKQRTAPLILELDLTDGVIETRPPDPFAAI